MLDLGAGGKYGAVTESSLLERAAKFEDMMPYTCLTATTAPTIERLAALQPKTLALMAGFYRERYEAA